MVYIHGGANRKGTGYPNFDYSDPPELATQGVILVTFEYRLGIMGFFTNPNLDLENAGSSGNYGLRDQIAADLFAFRNPTQEHAAAIDREYAKSPILPRPSTHQ